MELINELIHESTSTSSIALGRPKLLALTNSVNSLIFKDLVVTQATHNPIATLFGLRYLDPKGKQFYHTQSTYGGEIGDRTGIESFDKTKTYEKGKKFKTEDDSVYEVISDAGFKPSDPSYSSVLDIDIIFHGILENNVRIVSDAMSLATAENPNLIISENIFKLDRWSIETRSRKIKSSPTIELIQDLTAAGFGIELIYDLLSKSVSEEINKDILQKLITVSTRHESLGDLTSAFLDLTGASNDPTHSRTVYRLICEMAAEILTSTAYRATYCVCSPKVHAMLSASGWLKDDPRVENLNSGMLVNGIVVYVDTTSKFDYAIVGTTQKDVNGDGTVGSLFYAPYTEQDGVEFNIATDIGSLNDHIMVNSRYGLSVNPYTNAKDGQQIIAGDDWTSHSGSSKYSRIMGVKF